MTHNNESPTRYEIECEIVPDAILFEMSVDQILDLDTTMGIDAISLMIRQMRLFAEAATYLLPRVKRVRRRIARCQQRIARLLDAHQEPQ